MKLADLKGKTVGVCVSGGLDSKTICCVLKDAGVKLAELSGCHPTYIGQLERGEKNATLESIDKIASALQVPLSQLFEKLGGAEHAPGIPLACYELLAAKTPQEQERLYGILLEVERYKNT